MSWKKPLLAEEVEDVNTLRYPLMAAFKKDGFRCCKRDGKALTRQFKPIPNHFVRKWVEENIPNDVEGELTINGGAFGDCQSAFMSEDGEPDFMFNAFDKFNLSIGYQSRYHDLITTHAYCVKLNPAVAQRFQVIEHKVINTPKELLAYEKEALAAGEEGLVVKAIDGRYKCGRTTTKEALLLRLVRWLRSEAEVIDVVEQLHNANEAKVNELGNTKRSSHKENMVPMGTFGSFVVKDLTTGKVFSCGGGEDMTKEKRQEIWDNRDKIKGTIICYKYKKPTKDLPRFPQWLGPRAAIDMGEPEE